MICLVLVTLGQEGGQTGTKTWTEEFLIGQGGAFRGNGVDVKLRVERILFNYYIHIKILLWDWGWNGGALNPRMGLGNEDRY